MAEQTPKATEWEPAAVVPSDTPAPPQRRGPDVFTLLMGLVCLSASAMTLTGWMPSLPMIDPRWILASGAILVGLLLLIASLRTPKSQR